MANKRATLISFTLYALIVVSVVGKLAQLIWQARGNEVSSTALLWIDALIFGMVIPIVFGGVAVLIVARRPGHAVGWLLLVPALAGAFPVPPVSALLDPPQQPTVLFYVGAWLLSWAWLAVFFPVFLLPLYFPQGSLLSRRWRLVPALALCMAALILVPTTLGGRLGGEVGGVSWSIPNPIALHSTERFLDSFGSFFNGPVWGSGLLVMALSGPLALFLRFRRGDSVTRQQIKWLLYAVALFAAVYVPSALTAGEIYPPIVDGLLFGFGLLAIPLAIGIAILRHRLYDIDIVIRKTLQYTLVSALLTLMYFGGVVVVQSVFNTAVSDSPLLIVLTTLAIAAMFNPLRRRVQEVIDRRFYRPKYDAQQVLAQFAQTCRDEADLDKLTTELARTVQETLQPEHVTVWLKRE